MSPVDKILKRLEGVGRNGNGYVARCPVLNHGKGRGDRNRSLSVSEGDDGRALLRCHAGCAVEDVVAAIGISTRDLFETARRTDARRRKPVATYDYLDASAGLLFQVVRYEPKGFSQRRPDGVGGWITRGVFESIRPVLYRLPRVLETAQAGGTVWVFEGEEDVHAAEGHGLVATTNPMGAGKWREHYAEYLTGANVIVVPDNDNAGRKHAVKVTRSLSGKAASAKILELPGLGKGEDFRDWMRNGGTVGELERLASGAPDASPSRSNIESDGNTIRGEPRFVSFGKMERPTDERSYVVENVFPQRFPSILFGDGGVAKSLIAASLLLDAARGAQRWLGQELHYSGPCAYVDFELDAEEQARRMYQLAEGVGLDRPPEGIYYMSAAGHRPGKVLTWALEGCGERGVELVLVDSIGFALAGDAEAAGDVLTFFRTYIDPFRAAGITVLMVDHQAKLQGGEAYHSKSPFGSVYKRNSTRSVVQAQAVDQRDGELTVRFRHHKSNFNARFAPFEAKLRFSRTKIEMEHRELDVEDMAGEGSLNATDKVRAALREGPSYPKTIAARMGLNQGTVQNVLTRLRRSGEVVPTGRKNDDGSEEVSLSSYAKVSDGVTATAEGE